ncbi:MAG: hypothetical protein ABI778_08180 [Ignavibacteriota bacterium]
MQIRFQTLILKRHLRMYFSKKVSPMLKFAISFFIFISSTYNLLQAQPLDWDSTHDVQILKSIASGAYASIIVEKGGLFDFHTDAYDSLFYAVSGDSITVIKFRVYRDTSYYEKKIVYNKVGTKLFTESVGAWEWMRTISRFDQKENVFEEFTNEDLDYHNKKTDVDSFFLKTKRVYDSHGNLIGNYRFKRDGAIESKRTTKYFYYSNQAFVIESDFINGPDLFQNIAESFDDNSGSGRTVCILDTLKRTKECRIYKYHQIDTSLSSRDVYYYNPNWSIEKQEHFANDGKLKFLMLTLYDSLGHDTLIKQTVIGAHGKEVLIRRKYDMNGFPISDEDLENGKQKFLSLSSYDKEGKLLSDCTFSASSFDNFFFDKHIYSYDSHGNLHEIKSYRNGKVESTEEHIYYYLK